MPGILRREESLLVVVDVQQAFYAGREDVDRGRLAAATAIVAWLAGAARALGVPIVLTEEDPARNGPTVTTVRSAAGPEAATFTKPAFGLAEVPEILDACRAGGRRAAVVCGIETDVCVAQSALGLDDAGVRAVVCLDGTYAPGSAHAHGLERLRSAGIEAASAKAVYYEWARTLDDARAIERDHPALASPPGFSL